jgi:AP-3 complex subunit delta-1
MRDDPYYIMDDRSVKPPVDDIDSIPVVRLDDLPPLPKGQYSDLFFGTVTQI